MHELKYQLVKEDYKNWIHWNVLRNESKKMKLFSIVIYIGFVVLYLGGSINTAKENPAVLIPNIIMVLIVGAAMFYTTSHQNQERLIWKKSGLRKLERNNNFPVVNMTFGDFGLVMEVPSENVTKEYQYSELAGILEIERLFLLEAKDKTWQFVAKSGFRDREEMDIFKAFIEEKIADAKENPEKYVKREEVTVKADGSGAEDGKKTEETDATCFLNDAEEIQPVDTSSMGKIGKMAHIMAAMAAEAEKEEAPVIDSEEIAENTSEAEQEDEQNENPMGREE